MAKPLKAVPQGGRCPICQQPTVADYRPFCSKRCADVDLGRWINGAYAIPAAPGGDDDEDGGLPRESGLEGGLPVADGETPRRDDLES